MNTSALLLLLLAVLSGTQATGLDSEASGSTGLRRPELHQVNTIIVDDEPEESTKNRPKHSRRLSSKSSKSCKSSKSSKGGCEEEESIGTRSCDGLRTLVADLTERIGDVGVETMRFRALTDQLEQTSLVATGGMEGVRNLQTSNETTDEDFEYQVGQLEDSVGDLDRLKELLSHENERVRELATSLHQAAVEWIVRNADLTNANSDLWDNVNALTLENLALQNERDELNLQIDDLSSHIDDLSGLIDDHAGLNGELNATTAELIAQIERLEAANAEYASQNQALEEHISNLEDNVDGLEYQNDILAGLNQDLNATAQYLDHQVDRLEGEVDELGAQNSRLEDLVGDLRNETDRLEVINDQLEANVNDLTAEVDSFANRTAELEGINQGLETIASFLNETAGDLDDTYESLTQFLAQQIDAYHSIARETLKNVYIQRVSLWDCAYRDHFGDEPFGSDEDLEIPETKYPFVLEYIDDRVLKQLCLGKNDFAHYLTHVFPNNTFTTNHFVSGINSYTSMAFNYYFPDNGEEGGLRDEDWALAGFACEGLPGDKRYLHTRDGLRL